MVKRGWHFYNEEKKRKKIVPEKGNYSLYVVIFSAPVGAATKADGQEEDEKKTDEGNKEPDGQAKMVFI